MSLRPPRARRRLRPSALKPEDDRDKRFSDAGKAVSRTRGEPKRREGRLTIQSVAGDGDAAERMRSLASVRRAREREKEKRKGGSTDAPNRPREVVIPDVITVQELSNRMAVRGVDIIKFLMKQGLMMKINDVIDTDTAELVADEFGMTVRRVSESDVETGFLSDAIDDEAITPRAPVVAIMGHVDHGKTSLLDALRTTDVAGGRGRRHHPAHRRLSGAPGQRRSRHLPRHPGPRGLLSAMRTRGANVTDIVVLVVAADDGVMPQTIEAIQHAKAANAPIIVAVNKIDKPDANPQKVVNELLQYEVIAESPGRRHPDHRGLGQEPDQPRRPDRGHPAAGRGHGPEGRSGTLGRRRGHRGQAGQGPRPGRHRPGQARHAEARRHRRGRLRLGQGPRPAERAQRTADRSRSVGSGRDPRPGRGARRPANRFAVVENEARARELTEYRARVKREKATGRHQPGLAGRHDGQAAVQEGLGTAGRHQGRRAGFGRSHRRLAGQDGHDEVRARTVYSGAGGITESDVQLAKSAGAPILGFNVRASKQARDLAEREGVEIRYYAIIYDLLDDMKGVLSGMLAPLQRETFLGNAEVLQVFDISKTGKIAGCRVSEGVVRKGAKVRIIRDDVVVLELGTLTTLKRFKDEVNEVPSGQECGMHFQGFQDIKAGDYIECFTVEEIKRTLD